LKVVFRFATRGKDLRVVIAGRVFRMSDCRTLGSRERRTGLICRSNPLRRGSVGNPIPQTPATANGFANAFTAIPQQDLPTRR